MKKILVQRRALVAALAAAGFLAAGIAGLRTSTAQPHPAGGPGMQATPVAIATVAESEVTVFDEFSGRLEAVERVEVRPRVAGAIQSAHFVEGALVKKGDLLVSLDPAPYAAEVERAEAQVVAAKARLDHAASEHGRAKRLWEESAIAQRELDERRDGEREAQANVRAAEAALQAARLNLEYTQVRAPVAGRVGKLEVTVGNLVAAGPTSPVLTTLVSVSPIYASFDADEQVIARALKELPNAATQRGELKRIPVEMATAVEDKAYHGKLQLIDNQVNAKSGTVRVRAVFDNEDGALIPGQFARLRLAHAKAEKAVLIAERAVGTDQDKKFVMIVGPDNKAVYREVTLGATVNGLRIVTSGLQPNERIVVNGLQRVRPGALLAPTPVSATAPEAKPATKHVAA